MNRNTEINPAEIRRNVPPGALGVIDRIKESGGEAFLVGGCLRDLLLGRLPNDWDIATNLKPEQVKPLFSTVHEVGAAFGTLIIPRGGDVYEVTTYRTESGYSDNRHPDHVAYTSNLTEDLKRRDFTINAMAWDPASDNIEDPFNGTADLEARLIRAVGTPVERFHEDALRLMRAIRFATQLEFHIEAETWAAIEAEAAGLEHISQERIRAELNKILLTRQPSRGLRQLLDSGLLRIFLPELAACDGVEQNRFHSDDVFTHSVLATDAAPHDNLEVRLAALLHDISKPETRELRGGDYTFYAHQVRGARKADRILRRLRYANDERERITHLVYHHMFFYENEWTDSAVRRFVREVGFDNISDLIAVRIADMGGNARKTGSTLPLEALLDRVDEVIAKDTALSVKDLDVNGYELIELGIARGPGIGRILRALLEIVLDDPSANEKETMLTRAKEFIQAGVHLRDDHLSER